MEVVETYRFCYELVHAGGEGVALIRFFRVGRAAADVWDFDALFLEDFLSFFNDLRAIHFRHTVV